MKRTGLRLRTKTTRLSYPQHAGTTIPKPRVPVRPDLVDAHRKSFRAGRARAEMQAQKGLRSLEDQWIISIGVFRLLIMLAI
jgi:hypothetical protein